MVKQFLILHNNLYLSIIAENGNLYKIILGSYTQNLQGYVLFMYTRKKLIYLFSKIVYYLTIQTNCFLKVDSPIHFPMDWFEKQQTERGRIT